MVSGSVDRKTEAEVSVAAASSVSASDHCCPSSSGTSSPVRAKESHAIRIWFALVTVVLLILWTQTQNSVPTFNFLVEGSAESEGASVLIDGIETGTLARIDQGRVKLIGLRCSLLDGDHAVEVSKPGFEPYKTTVHMRGEDYLNVKLAPQ